MDFSSEDFVKAIIVQNGNSQVNILNRKLDTGILGTETNYLSKIVGLTIDYEKDGKVFKKKFVVKALALAPLYDVGNSCGWYDREIKMYSKVLPEMSKLLKPDIFYPLSFESIYDEVLILEDLKADGYSTIDRMVQLDLPHSMEALKMLAKFHAASVKLNKTMDLEDVKSDLWFKHEGKENPFIPLFEFGYEIVAEILEVKIPECVEKFKGLKENVLKVTKMYVNENKNGINVLNHGDFHCNNIMFKHDQNGGIINGKSFDFQFSRWCSPIVDIVYFIINSVRFELFKTHLDDLLSFYVEELNKALKKHEYKETYEFEDIKKDFEKSWPLGLYILVVFSCLILAEPADPIDLDEGTNEDGVQFDAFRKSYGSKKYRQVLLNWVSYYHEKGHF